MDNNGPAPKGGWQLPRVSAEQMALTSVFMGAIWVALVFRTPSDEWWASLIASGVLLWALWCWEFVRANSAKFRIVRKKQKERTPGCPGPPTLYN